MSNHKTATAGNDEPQPLAAVVAPQERPAPASAPPSPRPDLVATLNSLPGSLLRGGSTLRPSGRMSVVSVDLAGGMAQTTYEGAIRQGNCAAFGSTITQLIPITADSAGAGAAVSYAEVPTDSLLKGDHVLVYGKGGRPETCGTIAGGPSQPPPAAPDSPPPG